MKLTALIPMLSVRDLQKSITFYRDRLGFHVINVFGEPSPKWCMLGCDAIKLMLNEPPAAEMDTLPLYARNFQVFYFYPDDVAALHDAWRRDGLPVTDLRVTDYGMKEFELRDPDNYWLWFGQESADPPTAHE